VVVVMVVTVTEVVVVETVVVVMVVGTFGEKNSSIRWHTCLPTLRRSQPKLGRESICEPLPSTSIIPI